MLLVNTLQMHRINKLASHALPGDQLFLYCS
jgi:hypothetical protein